MTERSDEDIDGFFSTARVAGRAEAVLLPEDSYLSYLYDHDDPKIAEARGMDYAEFAEDRYQAPFLQELLAYWRSLYDEPFVGITTDGVVQGDLYRLPSPPPETDPTQHEAAERLLAALTPAERAAVGHPIDAPEWRAWSNPEFVVHRVGLRLEDVEATTVDRILELVRACLSPDGYERLHRAMALNGFLGELVDLPLVMNERSYWFSLFGTPDLREPWGWQLFGHHVAVNFVTVGGRQVIAPLFLGAEPAASDETEAPLFQSREDIALQLAVSLTAEQRAEAVVFESVLDPSMPEGRVHPADERHVAGAFRDNRTVPFEGLSAAELDERQQGLLRLLAADAHLLLTEPQRALALQEFDEHLGETWFSWYGATDGSQPFYFRIQSPVLLTELDHHAGVWLSNRLPARFHVHTTLRHPNGNDYARALIAQWREQDG